MTLFNELRDPLLVLVLLLLIQLDVLLKPSLDTLHVFLIHFVGLLLQRGNLIKLATEILFLLVCLLQLEI